MGLSEEASNRQVFTASGRVFSETGDLEPKKSSQELLDVMTELILQDRNQFCQEISHGDVKLEVTLHLFADAEEISLRIGRKQMYVIKSIKELVQNIREQNNVSYGKNLEFIHMQSSFTKESLPFISFLLRVDFPTIFYQSRHRIYQNESKNLRLDAGMLDEVMELYAGKEIFVDHPLMASRKEVPVCYGDPHLPVMVKRKAEGKPARIEMAKIFLLEGTRHNYIFWKDCIYICSDGYCARMRGLLKMMAANMTRAERGEDYYLYHSLKSPQHYELYEKDFASFVSTLLPVMEKYTDLHIEGVDFSDYMAEEGVYKLYLDLTEHNEVMCRATAIYGEKEHEFSEMAEVGQTYRDVRIEYEIRTLLDRYFPEKTEDGSRYLLREDDDRLAELVEYGIRQLEGLAEVYVSEAFRKIRVTGKLSVSVGMSTQWNLLRISWDVSGMSVDELHDVLQAYQQKRKYFRLKSGELLNLVSSGVDILSDMQEDLQLSKRQLESGGALVPLYHSIYVDSLMRENAKMIRVRCDKSYQTLIEHMDEKLTRNNVKPEIFRGELREYQMQGYSWACSLAEFGFGGVLADDMGLGKTIQMIAFLCEYKEKPNLIVCPASLVYNWEAEIQKFAPSLRVCLLVGSADEREELLKDYKCYDVVITSYDLLRRDIKQYKGRRFGCEIIDEAQYIKNPSTQISRAVKSVESRVRFALTGTPIENRLSELWSIFDYVLPGYLNRYKHFKETFEEKILLGTEEVADTALKRLQRMIAPFLLRRLKKDVLYDLPDKIEEVVYTKFDKDQEQLYRAVEKNILMNLKQRSDREVRENKIEILSEILKLRQICCDPSLLYENYEAESAKLETCMEVISNAVEGGHKVLVFSQFTSMLHILEQRIRKQKLRLFVLTGSTNKKERRKIVERFQGGRADVCLISLKAGGTGLNLTAADVVIHYDPWWNVAAQNQATDRTHRIGQEKEVTVYKLIAKGTIEDRILNMQNEKQNLAEKVISAEGVSVSELSKEELLGLFEDN